MSYRCFHQIAFKEPENEKHIIRCLERIIDLPIERESEIPNGDYFTMFTYHPGPFKQLLSVYTNTEHIKLTHAKIIAQRLSMDFDNQILVEDNNISDVWYLYESEDVFKTMQLRDSDFDSDEVIDFDFEDIYRD